VKPTGTAPPALIYMLATVLIAGTGFAQSGLGRATAGSGDAEVVVTPGSAALAYKSTQSDQAALSAAVNKTVTWNAEPATSSAVDRTGYAAPGIVDVELPELDAKGAVDRA
jgi:hypothetical protein